ncbi:MAG: glutamate formimidoyltransferase [Acidobacteria bacterium]|nr:glutamate formimidoyltransferase [Acidobacteriota bacterium]
MRTLVECVPNFSEGRDAEKISRIVDAARAVHGVTIFDLHSDASHNRSVLTFVGAPDAVGEAAIRLVGEAARLIDMNAHRGEHPRIGSTDVVPFVPVEGVTMEDCVRIAHAAGEEIFRRFAIPVYFYEAAALRPNRRLLENIRRGQYEGLREAVLTDPSRLPDVCSSTGGPQLHLTAGATAVGARRFLVAFNVNLNTNDAAIAKMIARKIRTSGGGLPALKAIGVLLHYDATGGSPEQGSAPARAETRAQVAMNLTDFEQTSMLVAYQAVEREAAQLGISIHSSELVGLAPQAAFGGAPPEQLKLANFSSRMIFEQRLDAVLAAGL